MALTPRQKKERRLWKIRAFGLGYDEGGGGGGGGADLLTPVQNLFSGGEEGGIWDFSDASLLFTATDGTGVVSNGSAIAYATDLSGNGNHLLQATEGLRPAWNSDGYAQFASDVMVADWPATAQPVTRVSRTYAANWTAGRRFFSGSQTTQRLYMMQLGTTPQVIINAGSNSANVSVPLNQYNTVAEVANGASSNLRVNGADNTVNPGTGSVRGIAVAAEPAGGTAHVSLRVVRVIMIDRTLTTEELAAAEAWAEEIL